MYPVSNTYLNAIKEPVQQYDLHGSIGSVQFHKENVLEGSFSITNQCSDNNEVKIGQVYIGELTATFINLGSGKYVTVGQNIVPYFGLKISADTYENVPMGIYTITEAEWSAVGLTVKAYDFMAKFDKPFSSQVTGTLYSMAQLACESCGVQIANENFNSFVNGTENFTFALHPNNDIETYRDLISWVAQTLGCFVTANRSGQIEFRAYGQTVVDTLDEYHRFEGAKYADFVTKYTGLSCVNIEDGSTTYYNVTPDDGLTYNLGSNPLLQYGDVDTPRRNVLTALTQIEYVPFSITSVSNPAYDLGDVLSFPGGLGDADKLFCITKYTIKFNGEMSLSGAGKNPALSSARSKTDKELIGISKNKNDDTIQYYSFTNTDEIIIGDTETKTIIDIRYTAIKNAVAVFHAEINLEAETSVDDITYSDAVGMVKYFVNEQMIENYFPTETWRDGEHILHLLYYLHINAGTVNHFEAVMNMQGGSATIKIGRIKACIYGQNLVASDDWGGILRIMEEAPDFAMKRMVFGGATELVTVGVQVPEAISSEDTATDFVLKKLAFESAAESINFIAIIPNRKTESGIPRITEDGEIRKVDS